MRSHTPMTRNSEAVVTLADGHTHSIDIHPDNWVSIWDEGLERAIVEIFDKHQFSHPTGEAD